MRAMRAMMRRLMSQLKVSGRRAEVACGAAQQVMSSFIDSMASPEEIELLESHLVVCEACQRQLQAYRSVKNLMLSAVKPEVPGDLVLETRVRLSRLRNANPAAWVEAVFENLLKPLALPAIAGISTTLLFFVVLLGSFSTPEVMAASDRLHDPPGYLYKRVRAGEPTMRRFMDNQPVLNQPLTVETEVGENGRVIHYVILSGPEDPKVDRWLREMLFYSEFKPATLFGRPVHSRIILSFVGVTS